MLDFLLIGGYFMWPIFVLMVLAFMVILEKIFNLYIFQSKFNADYKINLADAIKTKNLENLKIFCEANKNVISDVILEAIDTNNDDLEYENIMQNKINELSKGEFLLGIAISICPQLGLLGTVTGMISAFSGLSDENTEALVATGISEALYTTAYGLSVAVFALVFHVVFSKRIDCLNNEIYYYLSSLKKARM